MKRKTLSNEDYLAARVLSSCFSVRSRDSQEVLRAFARYVGGFKLNQQTAPLFLKILATNEPEAVNGLIGNRHPFVLFRHTKPNREILEWSFYILSGQDPVTIYPPVLFALLGIIDMAYKSFTEGSALREISVYELNHVAKYLDETADQYQDINRIILRILEHFYHHGAEPVPEKGARTPSIHSMRIRLAFLDTKYSLSDVIPEQILGPLVEPLSSVNIHHEKKLSYNIDHSTQIQSFVSRDGKAFYE